MTLFTFRPDGHFGKLPDRMVANHIEATDPVWLANLMRDRTKDGWQSEFWGKYMHAAVPFWRYTESERLGAKIAAGVKAILDLQEPDGYIGNYAPDNRYGRGWDVWGTKYTLMGLIHYSDGVEGRKSKVEGRNEDDSRFCASEYISLANEALEAAKRLCDCLIAARGPERASGA